MADSTITLRGSLTRDPELRFSAGGNAVAGFGIAVNRRWQRDGEWQEEVAFIDVTCFGNLAENVAQSCTKGSRVILEGYLKQENWEDRDSGAKRSKLVVIADEIGVSVKFDPAVQEKRERSKTASSGGRSRAKADPVYGDEEPF